MTPQTALTVEQIMEHTRCSRDKAERIAQVAALQDGTLSHGQIGDRLGIPYDTAYKLNVWANAVRKALGMADVQAPRRDRRQYRSLAGGGPSGGHQSQHVGRGIVSPDCPLCRGDAP